VALGAGEQGLGLVCDGLVATVATGVAVAVEPDLRDRVLAADAAALIGLTPVVEPGDAPGAGACAALAVLRLACAG
jgi:nicotinate-nucleotide--dimethylbenzimidazole phosphoribosyltransferase